MIKKEKGFTLIELMVSISLISVIIVGLFSINLAGWKFWNINNNSIQASQTESVISAYLDKAIRNNNKSDIKIQSHNGKAKSKLVINDVKYYINDNEFIKNTNGTERVIMSDNIKGLTFSNGDVISYELKLIDGDKIVVIDNAIKPRLINSSSNNSNSNSSNSNSDPNN